MCPKNMPYIQRVVEWRPGVEYSGETHCHSGPTISMTPCQEALPPDATILGVVLSSDKTNISIMSGNHMAHPVLISLANINANIRSKASLHTYLLLALLPIAKFTHKTTRVHSLLQDWLVHSALNIVLSPLKTAAAVGIMMNDPAGNLHYCFRPGMDTK